MTDHISNTPPESKDYWSTPQWMYDWLDSVFKFEIDLAANKDNAKHEVFYTEEDNSLEQDWSSEGRKVGFLNPPYSNTKPWIKKAVAMKEKFTTVMPIPTPNGEAQYKDVFEHANDIVFINGRIAFVASCDFTIKGKNGKPDKHIKKGDEVSGNSRGTCVVVFGSINKKLEIGHVDRDAIKNKFGGDK